jgi:basic amino acid/polyamine antiporter, APA family
LTAATSTESAGTVVNVPSAESVRREVSSKDLYVRQSSGLVRTVGPRTALFANLVAMGIIVNYFWIVYASAGYPNADLITTVAIGVLINVGVGYVYWMLSSAMPRSGGDYVFMGRIFHPSIGLGTNLLFSVVFISWSGLFAYYVTAVGLPMMFASFGVSGGNMGPFNSYSTLISTNLDIFLISFVVLLFVLLLSLLPTKWVFRATVGIFVITAIIYVLMLGIMLTTSQATFAAHWNAQNPASQSYATLAASGASVDAITLGGTFLGIVYTMLSFIGYANSSYFAGEIRGNPTRTQGLAIFGAPIIFAGLIGALYAATYYTFGRDFIVGVSGGAVGGTVTLNALPSPLFLAAYLTTDPWLASFLTFGLVLTFFGFAFIYFIIPTRNLFAWSFDRILPGFFTRVSSGGVPYVAVITLFIAAILSLYVAVYTTLFDYLTYSNFGFWLAVGIVCLGGALFPFLRPKLFAQAPRIVQARIGPVPILTIVGIASWIGSWFVSYAASTIQYLEITGPYPYSYLLFLPIVFVIGVVAYFASYAIQKTRGVPVELISKELPPD